MAAKRALGAGALLLLALCLAGAEGRALKQDMGGDYGGDDGGDTTVTTPGVSFTLTVNPKLGIEVRGARIWFVGTPHQRRPAAEPSVPACGWVSGAMAMRESRGRQHSQPGRKRQPRGRSQTIPAPAPQLLPPTPDPLAALPAARAGHHGAGPDAHRAPGPHAAGAGPSGDRERPADACHERGVMGTVGQRLEWRRAGVHAAPVVDAGARLTPHSVPMFGRPLTFHAPLLPPQLSGTGVFNPAFEAAGSGTATAGSTNLRLQGGEISRSVPAAAAAALASPFRVLANRPLLTAFSGPAAGAGVGSGALLNSIMSG
jgi:hypothetical protein